MPSTGFTLAGAGAEIDDGNEPWNNPGNITADDGSVAITDRFPNETSQSNILAASQFGFAIPSGATIDGIEVRVQARKTNSGEAGNFQDVILRWNSSEQGTAQDSDEALTDSLANYDFGGSANGWSASPTPADVNRSDFGVGIRMRAQSSVGQGSEQFVEVDAVWINVHYTLPSNHRMFLVF